MTSDTEVDEESTAMGRREVLDASSDRNRGALADIGTRKEEPSKGILTLPRRGALAVVGALGTGLLSGCTQLITGGPVSAEATPAILPPNHVRPTGELSEVVVEAGGFGQKARARRSVGKHSVDVAGRSLNVETENWAITYQRTMGCDSARVREEVGCDSEFVLGETVLFSTPQVEVVGNGVNPIDGLSPRDIVDEFGAAGGGSGGPTEQFASGEFENPADVLRFSYGGAVSEVRNVQSRSDGWETVSGEGGSAEVSQFTHDVRLQSGEETPANSTVVKTTHDGDIVFMVSWARGRSSQRIADSMERPLVVSDIGDIGDSPPIHRCDCSCDECCSEDSLLGDWWIACDCWVSGWELGCDALFVVASVARCPDDECIGYVDDNVFGPVEDYNEAMREAVER